ncbi:MAG TPA: hypothetical protein VGV38_14895, partial [Pyrinomonadaceae bacterium]|nr:hypothetical protein [Pyrinomonadaceae bacterium]
MPHDRSTKHERRARLFALGLFVAAGLAAYSNVLDAFFLSDDFAQIGKVLEGDLSVTWGREHGGFFRPLFILSYALDAALWGRRPSGYHLTNVLLHSLNAFLVFLLAERIGRRTGRTDSDPPRRGDALESDPTRQSEAFMFEPAGRRWLAYASALVFLLHPSHTEAVSWISGRADLLSTLFCLLALLAFLSHARTRRRASLVFALVAFALALLSKEAALCFPLLAALAGIYFGRESDGSDTTSDPAPTPRPAPSKHAGPKPASPKRALPETLRRTVLRTLKAAWLSSLPFICVLLLYVAARAYALGALVGGYGAGRHLYLTHGVVASQLLRAALRLLFPANALRSLPFLESRALSPTLIALGVALLVTSALVFRRAGSRRALVHFLRRNKLLWLLFALSLAALLPALNLRINVYDTQGERFLYLSSAFFSVALALALTKAARRRPRLSTAALACLLLLYALGLRQTNRTWREASQLSRSLVEDATRLSARADVLLLNAPDNLRGAYVFRNGFDHALRTLQDAKTFGRVGVAAVHDTQSREDAAELKEDDGVITVRLSNPRAAFA